MSVPHPSPTAAATLWRLSIVFSALYGPYRLIFSTGEFNPDALYELSQLAGVVVGVCYLGLALFPLFAGGRRDEPASAWLRGALALLMLLVSLTSILILNGGRLSHGAFFFEHLVAPVMVVLDFVFVGRNQFRTRWWHPLTWLLPPLAYFVFLLATGVQAYGWLFSPHNPYFAGVVAGFVVGLTAVGYALFGIVRLRATLSARPAA
ncbi:hypothetical protein LX16_1433 [Stackebrandtia albiflava]|uniref:FAR-17a/AIG1-like protein n=1 Tax=Stackebrandtia albiflava TaxID=406432 RepID=A0A562VCW6_9ACTN|nr:hypothetical protein [Stackebrandtia albiflava]TWJ15719.1 hypothetical protein LX16_1433 [Stackebrandtia albiflava]